MEYSPERLWGHYQSVPDGFRDNLHKHVSFDPSVTDRMTVDYDGYVFKGSPYGLSVFTGPTFTMSNHRVSKKYPEWMHISSEGAMVYVERQHKIRILRQLRKFRKKTFVAHTKPHILAELVGGGLTMDVHMFVNLLRKAKVKRIIVEGFNHKSYIDSGRKLYEDAKTIDPSCFFSLDIALNVPPQFMHWGCDVKSCMAPLTYDEEDK